MKTNFGGSTAHTGFPSVFPMLSAAVVLLWSINVSRAESGTGVGVIDESTFAPRVEFATGQDPTTLAIGDLDGDGRPDLALVNYQSHTLSVYRNVGFGGIAADSLAPRVDFPAGPSPASIALGDLDGDGKLDIVVANDYGANISVYRNLSTPGSFSTDSLAPRVDFLAGIHPVSVVVADLDGDGKADIAVANAVHGPSTIGVYRNVGASGEINESSFAPMVEFPTGDYSFKVAVGDLDGDGKPDLAAANIETRNVSILRNTATAGGLDTNSFAPKLDLDTAGSAYDLLVGDVDGDGKADLIVARESAVSIFRNVGLPGSLEPASFAPRVDLPTAGIAYEVKLGDLDRNGKPDLAVTVLYQPAVSVFQNRATSGSLDPDSFGPEIDYPGAGNSLGLGDLDSDGRMDMVTCLSTVMSVYWNTGSAPFPPYVVRQPQNTSATVGDTVRLNVVANGTTPLGYQWWFNGGPLSDATGSSLVLGNVQTIQAGGYSVVITNAHGAVTSAVAALTVNLAPACVAAPRGLVAWWPGNGDASEQLTGTAGIPHGVDFAPGKVKQAFNLTAPRTGVDVGNPASLRLQTLTIEAWIKRATPSLVTLDYYENAVIFGYSWGGYALALANDGRLMFSKVGYGAVYSHLAVTDTEFHHVAVTTTGTNVVLYLDGVGEMVGPYSPGFLFNGPAAIGARGSDFYNAFFGFIDEVSVYGRALTVAEIQSIHNAGVGGKCVAPQPPLITRQPAGRNVTVGSEATFTVEASGTPPLSYQWLFNGGALIGAVTPTLALANVQFDQAGDYAVVVTNSNGAVTSAVATLTVNPLPRVYDLSADYSQASNPNGAWTFGSASVLTGPLARLTYSRVFNSDNGVPIAEWSYSPMVAPIVNRVIGNTTAVSAGGAFVGPPGTVYFAAGLEGAEGNFSVIRLTVPRGGDGTYQIATAVRPVFDGALSADSDFHVLKNGQELFGRFLAPNEGTEYTNTLVLLAGDVVDFAIGRGADGVQLRSALKIQARLVWEDGPGLAPVIVRQPASQTVTVGSDVAFTTEASGTPPLSYQWQFNGGALSGADKPTLALTNVQASQAGNYAVVVTNAYGAVTSAVAVLTVNPSSRVYDLSADYSLASNPNGAWAYGVAGALGGVLRLCDASRTFLADNGVPIGEWRRSGTAVLVNRVMGPGTAVSAGGAFVGPPGTMYFTPPMEGSGDNFGVVRFAVPAGAGGTYRIEASVRPLFDGSLATECVFSVARNGQELYGRFLAPNEGTGYTNRVALAAGDAMDFAIGRGADGVRGNAGLKIQARLVWEDGTGLAPVITRQPEGQTVLPGSDVTFVVEASGTAPLEYQWLFDGQPVAGATAASLCLTQVQVAQAGNYSAIVTNNHGAVTSAAALLTIERGRALTVVSPPDGHEGELVSVPLRLQSQGDVGGMTFWLRYNADYLAQPEVVWDPILQGGLKEQNVGVLGVVRCVFALPATVVPAGVQTLATINFRVRTLLTNTTVPLTPQVIDVSGTDGVPLTTPTAVWAGSVRLLAGDGLTGDNNGNRRLDVGDATLVMRLLAQLDTTRPWDVPRNDLNRSGVLDSGDVIKILQAVAVPDSIPTPWFNQGGLLAAAMPMAGPSPGGAGAAVLFPSRLRAEAGERITLQVRLQGIPNRIAGAAFKLRYPLSALRLSYLQPCRTGSLVPGSAAIVWKTEPAAGIESEQTGEVTLAASSASPWSSSEGTLAEITFEVQPGAAAQYLWPIALAGVEVTGTGYDCLPLVCGTMDFVGRDPRPPVLSINLGPQGQRQCLLAGDAGARYLIEVSDDLRTWVPLATVSSQSGSIPIVDPDAAQQSRRFYRAQAAD